MLDLLRGLERHFAGRRLDSAGKGILVLILALLFIRGIGNYGSYRATVESEDERTGEVLYYIGEPDQDTQFVNNGIMHIGWTVLSYYFPDSEVVNGDYRLAASDDVWYFTPEFLDEDEMAELRGMGYDVIENYSNQQLGKYPFILYHFGKEAPGGSGEADSAVK